MLESDSLVRLAIGSDQSPRNWTADKLSSAPTHKDGVAGDVIVMLPLASFVMSHFERELSSEQ